jgi:anti-sigma B factor antagonist
MSDLSAHRLPRSKGFAIERHTDRHGVVLALRGELDLGSAPDLEQGLWEVEKMKPGRLIIDLSGLDFIDAVGLSLMVRAQQSAHTNGYPFALRRGPAQVQRVFELTGLIEHLTFLGR